MKQTGFLQVLAGPLFLFFYFSWIFKKNLAAAYAAVCVSFFYESILFRGTSSFSVSFTLFCVFVFVV